MKFIWSYSKQYLNMASVVTFLPSFNFATILFWTLVWIRWITLKINHLYLHFIYDFWPGHSFCSTFSLFEEIWNIFFSPLLVYSPVLPQFRMPFFLSFRAFSFLYQFYLLTSFHSHFRYNIFLQFWIPCCTTPAIWEAGNVERAKSGTLQSSSFGVLAPLHLERSDQSWNGEHFTAPWKTLTAVCSALCIITPACAGGCLYLATPKSQSVDERSS